MKNIVICADGTGNTTIKGRGTNVFKLYEAVDQTGHLVAPGLMYDSRAGACSCGSRATRRGTRPGPSRRTPK